MQADRPGCQLVVRHLEPGFRQAVRILQCEQADRQRRDTFCPRGPPSPISGNAGSFNNRVVNVGGLTASTNPRVTHIWIFGTTDLAEGQAGNLIFVGEIANGTTSFEDSLTVEQLDSTRVLPIDKLPYAN
jgi:hypothetical protein